MSDDKQVVHLDSRSALGLVLEIAARLIGRGWKVTFERIRSGGQNRRFHWLCGLLAASSLTFAGKRRSKDQWKRLLVSGHAIATKQEQELVTGLEGELVDLRESTAQMGVARSSSLIEYTQAFMVQNDVDIPVFEEQAA